MDTLQRTVSPNGRDAATAPQGIQFGGNVWGETSYGYSFRSSFFIYSLGAFHPAVEVPVGLLVRVENPVGFFVRFLESRAFERALLTLIVINAVTLGLETSEWVMRRFEGLVHAVDQIILSIFVVELALRLLVRRLAFFRDPWSVFDFVVVSLALLPTSAAFSVLRALRVLRLLRTISILPSLRRVGSGLVAALPGMGSIILLISLLFYVSSVMATKLFGAAFPEWFGSIGASAYSLFQIMTLESWSMGMVRPVMEVYPWSWAFFVPFILITTFVMLNLVIGVIVNAMQNLETATVETPASTVVSDTAMLRDEIRILREELVTLRTALQQALEPQVKRSEQAGGSPSAPHHISTGAFPLR